jgi:hypothetical protein
MARPTDKLSYLEAYEALDALAAVQQGDSEPLTIEERQAAEALMRGLSGLMARAARLDRSRRTRRPSE